MFNLGEWKTFIIEKLLPVINDCGEILEGNIYSFHTEKEYTNTFLEKQKNIANSARNLKQNSKILEIGFNSGYSALLMLMNSDESVKLTCVDINCHLYTVPCYNVLKNIYGDRISLITGSSIDVLPTLIKEYDLIHIDGCHSANIAEKDIQNSLKLVNNNCIIIMDDTELDYLQNIWNSYVTKYNLQNVNFDIFETKYHSIKQYLE